MQGYKKKTYKLRIGPPVIDLLPGEKNERRFGEKLNTLAINQE